MLQVLSPLFFQFSLGHWIYRGILPSDKGPVKHNNRWLTKWLIDWLYGFTRFSTVFQLYCTYPCFPGVLLTSIPHNIPSKPLATFPYNSLSKQWTVARPMWSNKTKILPLTTWTPILTMLKQAFENIVKYEKVLVSSIFSYTTIFSSL